MTADLDSSQRALLLRSQQRPLPVAALIAALLPLSGVWLLDWPVEAMFGLYWAETVVIGVFHGLTLFALRGTVTDPELARVLADDPTITPAERAQRIETDRRRQLLWIPWFAFAFYGLFFAAHAGGIAVLFDGAFASLATGFGLASLVAMSVQPALDYRRFRADDELRSLPAGELFFRPFKRVGVMQLALLLGAIPVNAGYPLAAALVLTALKLCVELGAGGGPRAQAPLRAGTQAESVRPVD
jgi:hypothetical protein